MLSSAIGGGGRFPLAGTAVALAAVPALTRQPTGEVGALSSAVAQPGTVVQMRIGW
jgi:hypothetical protein